MLIFRERYMNTGAAAQQSELQIRNHFAETLNTQLAEDVLQGLTAEQKYIPSKYFYDARGSRLFELICRLPEYYLTRKEMGLLKRFARAIISRFKNGDLVELGSGANWKIRMLLDAMSARARATVRYVPVDVSESAILAASDELVRLYPELSVAPLVADFTKDFDGIPCGRVRLMLLFGSTIGNLPEDEMVDFFRPLSGCLGPGDRFLVGLDMIKPTEILEAAYNDSQNVTALFNKNILLVLNNQLSANFSPSDFDHVAFFNNHRERVEMHLRAKRRVIVDVPGAGLSVSIEKGETIRTEICRKFRRESVENTVQDAGLHVSRWYSDDDNWFSIAEIVAR
jgi:L-histidine N-alpha-methyltransferase